MQDTVKPAGAGTIERLRLGYGLILEWVVMILMLVLFVEVTLGIVFRASGHSLVWYDEVASVLLAWLTFYGSALASVKRAHIGCPEVVDQLPARVRQLVAVFVQILVIAFFALLGWVGMSILPILAGDTMVSLTWVPMGVVQSVIPVSYALILIAEGMNLVELLDRKKLRPGAALADGLH